MGIEAEDMILVSETQRKHRSPARHWSGVAILFALCCWLGGWQAGSSWAQAQDLEAPIAQKKETIDLPFLEKDDGFVYKSTQRSDPFMPLEYEAITEGEMDVLTGMRRFEPRQLSLVAVISKGEESVAMVEGPDGKGYLLGKGMLVGRNGLVDTIIGNRMIIKEAVSTRTGEKRYNFIELVLRRGEDQDK